MRRWRAARGTSASSPSIATSARFDQDIVIAPIADRFKVYMDPIGLFCTRRAASAKWGFIVEDLPKEEYEELHGDEHPIDWGDTGIGDQMDWFPNKDTVRIAEYFAIENTKKKLLVFGVGEDS
jgi:hypothetical protein